MQQAVDATQIHECTIVGDVFDDTLDGLAFFEVLNQLGTQFRTGFFQNDTARHNDVATTLVHFQDLERLWVVHQRGHVANRADIHLGARQEGNSAIQIDSETTFDLVEDDTLNFFFCFEGFFQLAPALFTTCFVARQDSFAHRIFDTLEVDFNLGANLKTTVFCLRSKLLQSNTAFDFQANIDDCHVFFDADNRTFDHGAFMWLSFIEGLVEQGGKIVHGRIKIAHKIS